MNPNILPSDRSPLVGVINPASVSPGSVSTSWIEAAQFENYLCMVQTGVLGTAATVNAKLEKATNSSGAGAADIDDKEIEELVKADHDNVQAVINLRTPELGEGFTHFRLSVTVGEAASQVSGAVIGFDARYEPVEPASSVEEVVT